MLVRVQLSMALEEFELDGTEHLGAAFLQLQGSTGADMKLTPIFQMPCSLTPGLN